MWPAPQAVLGGSCTSVAGFGGVRPNSVSAGTGGVTPVWYWVAGILGPVTPPTTRAFAVPTKVIEPEPPFESRACWEPVLQAELTYSAPWNMAETLPEKLADGQPPLTVGGPGSSNMTE